MKIVLALLLTLVTSTAMADVNLSGDFVGTATQVPTDLNSDGEVGRSFQVRILQSRIARNHFIEAAGVIDSGLAASPSGTCPAGTLVELEVHGEVHWRTRGGDMLLTQFRPQDPLCFTPGQLETITLDILPGGRGIYEGATGTVDIVLDDRVWTLDPASLVGLPAIVDTVGTYVINLD